MTRELFGTPGRVGLFLILTFALSWGFDLALALTVGHATFLELGLAPWSMFVPAAVALAGHTRRTPLRAFLSAHAAGLPAETLASFGQPVRRQLMDSNLSHIPAIGSLTSRFYETGNDLRQMQDMLMEARSRTDDWRYCHVGELTFGFFMVACHLNPQEHIHLWHNDHGKLVGYALLGQDPSFDWQILPEYEWSGIETEAMAWAETYLAQLRQRDAQQWGGGLVAGARQDNGRRRVFLGQHGFRYSGEFAEVNMLRSLDEPIPDSVLPPGCQVRAVAGTGEIPQRAAAHREVWQPWTDGNVSDQDYAYFMQLPGYNRDLDLVAVTPDGVIAATVNGWIDPVNRIGNFGQVGALPAYRRRGLTRATLLEGLHRMRARGMDRVCISTGVSNVPAIRLYKSVGFEIMNQYLDYVKTM